MNDSRPDTRDHIGKVKARLAEIRSALGLRGRAHDRSKLDEPERSILDARGDALAGLEYGTPAYAAALATVDMRPFLDHHYAANAHHPEHWPSGIRDMSLLDIVEMLADWKAASERTRQGSIAASLAHNRERFGIGDQLAAVLENTVRELGW